MKVRTKQIKTENQIKLLKKAAKITVDIFKKTKEQIVPGKTETEIRSLINSLIKAQGLRPSFDTIVACGNNCSNIHALAGSRKIRKNDMVMLDLGVIYKGMHSDLTRMVIVGNGPCKKLMDIYKMVCYAQKWSIRNLKAGIKIKDHAKAVHDLFRKKGYGKFIRHTLGHGVGSRIHEAPKISERSLRVFKENMVVTIEPGLYIDRLGGSRIEDMVIVKKKGTEVITR